MLEHVCSSKRAQMKIQQMAFMLVAVMIFFGMVALVYFTISIKGLQDKAEILAEEDGRRMARQLAGTPELAYTVRDGCDSCLDLDKAFQLSTINSYAEDLWNLDYLMIERISPSFPDQKCTSPANNYPNGCNEIEIIAPKRGLSGTKTAFVALVRWDDSIGGSPGAYRYEFGRIHVLERELGS